MTDDVDNLDPDEAEEIMDAMRYSGRFTPLAAGRELLRLKAENDRLRKLVNQKVKGNVN